MASHLDLEEQEQLEQLKAFWKQYGNLITWVVILALTGFSGWMFWQKYQRDQGAKASVLYDELDKAVQAGDVEKAVRANADMKQHFARTGFAQQSGLLTAKLQYDKGQFDAARESLAWVGDNARENEYKAAARLRLSAILLDQKKYDEALKQLDGANAKEFAGLVADRRGDVLLAQGKPDQARAAYELALKNIDDAIEYRRSVDAKFVALGGSTEPQAAVATTTAATASGASK